MATDLLQHPLVRHGTHQRERLAGTLQPANLRLDDRSVADLLAFVAAFARHVRFWPVPSEEDGTGNPLDWSCFWQRDTTVLLAVVAATDVRSLRTRYRDHELAYYRAKKKLDQGKPLAEGEPTPEDSLRELVETIFAAARQLAFLCQQLPASHPLQAEVLRICGKLQGSLNLLIVFNKGVVKRSLLDKYALFIGTAPCQIPWGLPTAHEFFCITYRSPQDTDLAALWRLFLAFANALAVVVSKADKAFQYALHSRPDHPPHVALMLAFLNLFRYLQADLNALPEQHLLFYYLDVLRLAPRLATPDRAYLVFQLAQNQTMYRLVAGTEFVGGKDRLGLDRRYVLEDELVLNQAVLLEKKSLYFYKAAPDAPTLPLAAPAADFKDGIIEPFAAGEKAWSIFGPKAYYQQLGQKLAHLKAFSTPDNEPPAVKQLRLHLLNQQSALKSRPGLIIASPTLWMEKSDLRRITLTFGQDVSKLNFSVQLSTEGGPADIIFQEKKEDLVGDLNRFFDLNFPSQRLTSNPLDGKATFWVAGTAVHLYLPAAFPAIKPFLSKEGALLSDIKQPFILLQPTSVDDYDALAATLAATALQPIRLQTASRNVRNLTLQLGDTVYPTTAQIPLIGLTSGNSLTNLYVGAPEIAYKPLNDVNKQLSVHVPNRMENNSSTGNNAVGQPPTPTSLISREFLNANTWNKLNSDSADTTVLSFTPTYQSQSATYSDNSQAGFVRLQLSTGIFDSKKPVTTDKLSGDEVLVSYVSSEVIVAPAIAADFHQLYHYYPPFGFAPVKPGNNSLAPKILQAQPDALVDTPPDTAAAALAHGNLFLGFAQLVPGQTLSLLFQMAEGTGDPEKTPPYVAWSYLRHNEWVGLPQAYMLRDETVGLQQTGLVVLRLPLDITDQNTFIVGGKPGEKPRKDLFWLRAAATEGLDPIGAPDATAAIEALPLLVDVHAQAGSVVFQNHLNSLEHLEKGLPPNTITQLRVRDVNVRQVQQPYVSFGGRLPEADDRAAYFRRISERLRHRQRAVTVWDYERLALEKFPKIALVKCLPHTSDNDVNRAGQVTVAVVPYPAAMLGNRRFYPSVEAGQLTTIATYLNHHNSLFVSGLNCTSTCCCDDQDEPPPVGGAAPTAAPKPCGCHQPSTLQVRNAVFEPVRLTVCVRFRAGKDPAFYRTQLNAALKNFLAPWASDATRPILFGAPISLVNLLRFLENTDYVDVVTQLRVTQYASQAAARAGEAEPVVEFPDELVPLTPRSVLTTYLNSLDEDNPNAIDHIINYFTEDGCRCSGCLQETLKRFVVGLLAQAPPLAFNKLRETLNAYLQKAAVQGDLAGEIPDADFKKLPSREGDAKGNAYWFSVKQPEPAKGPVVTMLLTLSTGAEFTKLVVTTPNSSPAHA